MYSGNLTFEILCSLLTGRCRHLPRLTRSITKVSVPPSCEKKKTDFSLQHIAWFTMVHLPGFSFSMYIVWSSGGERKLIFILTGTVLRFLLPTLTGCYCSPLCLLSLLRVDQMLGKVVLRPHTVTVTVMALPIRIRIVPAPDQTTKVCEAQTARPD